jgi:hypothetical protein
MPRYGDDWAVSKSLFEYTTGGSCACCSFPTLFNPDGFKGLVNAISDLETDAANAEINAADQSPWPPEMRDSVWADRVKVRHKMKLEMKGYREFMEEAGEEALKEFCKKELGGKKLRQMFQMGRTEVTNILSERYQVCAAFGTIMCAVVEQIANFKLTKYPTDARGEEEIEFENVLRHDRFGGFVLDICNDDDDDDNDNDDGIVNEEVLQVFVNTMKSLGGPKLLHRGPSTTQHNDDDENNDNDNEGGADDADKGEKDEGKSGPSFRSDRRIARLVIARYWSDQIISKYQDSCKAK